MHSSSKQWTSFLRQSLSTLEQMLEEEAGEFMCGIMITVVDIIFYNDIAQFLKLVDKSTIKQQIAQRFPRVTQWYQVTMGQNPLIQELEKETERVIRQIQGKLTVVEMEDLPSDTHDNSFERMMSRSSGSSVQKSASSFLRRSSSLSHVRPNRLNEQDFVTQFFILKEFMIEEKKQDLDNITSHFLDVVKVNIDSKLSSLVTYSKQLQDKNLFHLLKFSLTVKPG